MLLCPKFTDSVNKQTDSVGVSVNLRLIMQSVVLFACFGILGCKKKKVEWGTNMFVEHVRYTQLCYSMKGS